MHTSAYKSCRIHHNGAYDGDIYITNKDSTSDPVSTKAKIAFTTKGLISLFMKHKYSKPKTIVIKGDSKEECDSEIKILFMDLRSYVEDILIDQINEKMKDELELPYEKLEQIASILNIDLKKIE